MRVLLDTNILLDIFLDRPFEQDHVARLGAMRTFGDSELWVSAKSYVDAFYIMKKAFLPDAIQAAFDKSFEWINICSVDSDDIKEASRRRWEDFEDCLICVCAEKVKADYLVTRDEKGFEKSRIPHGTASQFMEFVKETLNIEYDIVDC